MITYCGYIVGFPTDTPQSIARDIEIIQRELPVDLLEFFILTPLPGSQDHKDLYDQGVWMDPDMNKYDLEHVTTGHPLMTAEELQGIYDQVWHLYYSWSHIETLLKRAMASGIKPARLGAMIFDFYASYLYERVHPLQSGVFRRKIRKQRRYGLPVESPVIFYPRRVWETLRTYVPGFIYLLRLTRLRKRIQRDPQARNYTDLAITPVSDEGDAHLDMFEVTDAARTAVKKARATAETIRKARERVSVEVTLKVG